MMTSTAMQGHHSITSAATSAQGRRLSPVAALPPADPAAAGSPTSPVRLPGFQQDALSTCLLLAIALQLHFGVAAAHALPGDVLMQRMSLAVGIAFAARALWRLRGAARPAPL